MTKLIFLDIDGVMNSSRGQGPCFSDMEEGKLLLLKRLIDESGAKGIVLTSDRRYSEVDMRDKSKAFAKFGIPVIGVTRRPYEEDDDRGRQIADYLSSSIEDIEKIVILDDNDDGISYLFPKDFILVHRFFGLNEAAYEKALRILG